MAATDMKAEESPIPIQPTRREAAGSPAPNLWPTRTQVAWEIPSGTMYVVLATLITIWCAAKAAGSRRPARIVARQKTPTSSRSWKAAGSPR